MQPQFRMELPHENCSKGCKVKKNDEVIIPNFTIFQMH